MTLKARVKVTQNPDDMAGQCYLPEWRFYSILVEGAGYVDLCSLPAGTWITELRAHIGTALDGSGTVTIGWTSSGSAPSDIVAGSDWTETTINQALVLATATPAGIYKTSADVIRVTVGGSPTLGEIWLAFAMVNMVDMAEEPNNQFTVT